MAKVTPTVCDTCHSETLKVNDFAFSQIIEIYRAYLRDADGPLTENEREEEIEKMKVEYHSMRD